jgi:hypothetical protein
MKLLDERNQVKEAIRDWIAMYGMDRTYFSDKRGRDVGRELSALDPETATAVQVAEIIGNPWARPRPCDECGVETWKLVELGEPASHESATANVCADCLRKALALAEVSDG